MRKLLFTLFALIAPLTLCKAQEESQAPVNKGVELVTKYYTIEDIRGISANHIFDIELTYGNSSKIEITAAKEYAECIVVRKKDGVLFFDIDLSKVPAGKKKQSVTTRINGKQIHGPFTVKMQATTIEFLRLNGAARIKADGEFEGHELKCHLSGTSQITDFNTKAKDVDIHTSGASRMTFGGDCDEFEAKLTGSSGVVFSGNFRKGELELSGASFVNFKNNIDAQELDIEMSGSCKVGISGKTQELELEASGACNANLGELTTQKAEVKLSGASNAKVRATQYLEGKLSGAAKLQYNFKGDESSLVLRKSGAARFVKF